MSPLPVKLSLEKKSPTGGAVPVNIFRTQTRSDKRDGKFRCTYFLAFLAYLSLYLRSEYDLQEQKELRSTGIISCCSPAPAKTWKHRKIDPLPINHIFNFSSISIDNRKILPPPLLTPISLGSSRSLMIISQGLVTFNPAYPVGAFF